MGSKVYYVLPRNRRRRATFGIHSVNIDSTKTYSGISTTISRHTFKSSHPVKTTRCSLYVQSTLT